MNDDNMSTNLPVGSVTITDNGDYAIMTNTGIIPMTIGAQGSSNVVSTISAGNITRRSTQSFLDEYEFNHFTIDHKVSEVEILKLKEVKPDYADDIKENIAKNLARDITKKVSFTKKKLPTEDTHHFIGRVWCFTHDELVKLIEDARNA